jgi:rhodanese-related sulfurtransferase
MDAHIQDLPFDPAALHRLSPGLITSHHQNNYGAALRRLNAIRAQLADTAFATAPGFQLDGLKREELIATNFALDMYEHAYHMDYGAAAGAYVDAFMGNIDWAAVYGRYQQAVHAASEPYGAGHDEIGDGLVLDVRRAGVFEKAQAMLPGARWCDPAGVAAWSGELPTGREVLVYCVYGHEVGRATAMRLRAAGLNARYLRGGIDGWQAAGRPLVNKPGSPTP